MKRCTVLKSFAAILTAVFTTAAQANTTVVLALADNYAPLMTPDGGIAGDILDEVNMRLGDEFEIEIQSVPWSRAVTLVESGRAHGLVGTYYRPNIRPWIDPYSRPLLQDAVSIFCRTGIADPTWSYPRDYAGLTFGFLVGSYAAGDEFHAMRDAGEISVDDSTTIAANLLKLKAGRIDCFVEGRLPIQVELAQIGGTDAIEMVGDVKVEDFYVGFQDDWAQGADAASFIAAFDETIEQMQADGTINLIIENGLE